MMRELPEIVRSTLERLKKEHKYSVSIAVINGSFYAYEAKSEIIEGKRRTVNLYLGKIKEDGTFIQAKHKKRETDAKTLEERIVRKLDIQKHNPLERMLHPEDVDLRILEAISANGRASISEIADYAGTTTAIAKKRLRAIETTYGITYIPEFGPRPFGFFRYVVFVRFFKGRIPEENSIKEIFEKEPRIQFAALLKGKYHLFLYMLAENTQALEDTLYRIRSEKAFADNRSLWQVSYITYAYGYTPIRMEFFDLLEERIWHRSKEHPRKEPEQILQREYDVLKALNIDGRKEFSEIDKELGLSRGSSDYTYYRLLEKKLVYRITIRMDKLPARLTAIIRLPQTDIGSFNAYRNRFRVHLIDNPKTPTNKYVLEGDIGMPYGFLFIRPIYGESSQEYVKELKEAAHEKLEPDVEIITDILVGTLGFRRIPAEETYQYKAIINKKKE